MPTALDHSSAPPVVIKKCLEFKAVFSVLLIPLVFAIVYMLMTHCCSGRVDKGYIEDEAYSFIVATISSLLAAPVGLVLALMSSDDTTLKMLVRIVGLVINGIGAFFFVMGILSLAVLMS